MTPYSILNSARQSPVVTQFEFDDRLRNVNGAQRCGPDPFYVRWLVAENGSLPLGKAPFPLHCRRCCGIGLCTGGRERQRGVR
jgi:hypothetical protein